MDTPQKERALSPVSRRAFLTAAPAAAAGAALLGACGGGSGYADVVYGDYANCYYCDMFYGGYLLDYTCCDGRFVCDGFC